MWMDNHRHHAQLDCPGASRNEASRRRDATVTAIGRSGQRSPQASVYQGRLDLAAQPPLRPYCCQGTSDRHAVHRDLLARQRGHVSTATQAAGRDSRAQGMESRPFPVLDRHGQPHHRPHGRPHLRGHLHPEARIHCQGQGVSAGVLPVENLDRSAGGPTSIELDQVHRHGGRPRLRRSVRLPERSRAAAGRGRHAANGCSVFSKGIFWDRANPTTAHSGLANVRPWA